MEQSMKIVTNVPGCRAWNPGLGLSPRQLWRDQFVEHAALAEQRKCSGLGRIGLEQSIHAEAFAGGAKPSAGRNGWR